MTDKRRQIEIQREALKEAYREWLDEKYLFIGKWTVRGVSATMIGALLYLLVWMWINTNGFDLHRLQEVTK